MIPRSPPANSINCRNHAWAACWPWRWWWPKQVLPPAHGAARPWQRFGTIHHGELGLWPLAGNDRAIRRLLTQQTWVDACGRHRPGEDMDKTMRATKHPCMSNHFRITFSIYFSISSVCLSVAVVRRDSDPTCSDSLFFSWAFLRSDAFVL